MPRIPCEQLLKTRAFGKLLCLCCPGRCFKRLWTKWKRRLEEEKKVIVIAFRVVVLVMQIVKRSFGTNLDGSDQVKDENITAWFPPPSLLGDVEPGAGQQPNPPHQRGRLPPAQPETQDADHLLHLVAHLHQQNHITVLYPSNTERLSKSFKNKTEKWGHEDSKRRCQPKSTAEWCANKR